MDPTAALEQAGGFATRRDLVSAGVPKGQLAEVVRSGRVLRVRRGVYGLGLIDGTDAVAGAALSLRGTVSHDSAAVLWGLEIVHRPGQHITIPRNRSRAAFHGAAVHRADLDAVEIRHGVRVTTPARTVVDCAKVLSLRDAVVVIDSALRSGLVSLAELNAEAERVRGNNTPKVRRAVALADPRCGSVLESVLRVLLVLAGLPPDQSQFVIRDQRLRFVARVDFVYLKVRLIVEVDGFEFHRERSDYRADRRKANAFSRLRWWLLRFTWEDVVMHPDYVVEAVRDMVSPTRSTARGHKNTQSAA
jgi:very-short-patch-repair endonuclease